MSLILTLMIFSALIVSCGKKNEIQINQKEKFTSELLELKNYFQIPGIAASISKNDQVIYKNFFGVSNLEDSTAVNETTLFPVASVTKVFSGVLILKLVEQKKLSLEDPIHKYFPESTLNDSILVKHVLSHTSQGNIGKEFYYSSRFGLLTKVIEQSANKSFSEVFNDEILVPLNLKNTFLLRDSTQISRIAKPYNLDNGIESGIIDYGYSTSAGIVSNLNDLAIFNKALDENKLIDEKSKELMFSSFNKELPYGYGIFHQEFQNRKIIWAYGQYDSYSSLLLKIPSENITLTLLANNNLLSDPARLIYGDALSSLFILSFLKNYILDLTELDLIEESNITSKNSITNDEFYRKKLLAQALSESYMARYDTEKLQSSAKLLNTIFEIYPDYLEYSNLNLLHNLTFLKSVAFYKELGDFNTFDSQIIAIGNQLHKKQSNNPYVNEYLGTFYDRKGNIEKAKYHFEQISNAKNFSKNWYTRDAEVWLSDHK